MVIDDTYEQMLLSENVRKTGLFLGVRVQTWLDIKSACDRRDWTVDQLLDKINQIEVDEWREHFGVLAEIIDG